MPPEAPNSPELFRFLRELAMRFLTRALELPF